MQLNTYPPTADERVGYARRRYRNRPLVGALTGTTPERCEQLLRVPAFWDFNFFVSQPVEPGRSILLQLRTPNEGSTQTLLAYVASAVRAEDGSWRVRCRFAPEA
jgi:hypothetical protein